MRYHHVGVPTQVARPGEAYLPEHHVHVCGFDESPYGIEWMRFEPGCTLPDLVKSVPHVAFVVDDLDSAVAGKEMLIPPNRPSEGVTVAFIVDNGAPVEFLQFDGPEHEVWPGGSCAAAGPVAERGARDRAERDVLDAWDAIRRAMLSNDAGALDCLLAGDYEGCGADGRPHSRPMLIAAYAPGAVALEAFEAEELRVHVLGETATVAGLARMAGSCEGQRFEHTARFLDVFVRRASAWLLVASQTTDTRTAAPGDSTGE